MQVQHNSVLRHAKKDLHSENITRKSRMKKHVNTQILKWKSGLLKPHLLAIYIVTKQHKIMVQSVD